VPEGEKQFENYLNAVMTISFPSDAIEPDVGVEKINAFSDRLREAMTDYEVKIIKQIADLSYTGNFVGEAGDTGQDNKPERYNAEIQIRGLIK
jgi:hypothetical protein